MHTYQDVDTTTLRPTDALGAEGGHVEEPERTGTLLNAAHKAIGLMLSDDSLEYLVRSRQVPGE